MQHAPHSQPTTQLSSLSVGINPSLVIHLSIHPLFVQHAGNVSMESKQRARDAPPSSCPHTSAPQEEFLKAEYFLWMKKRFMDMKSVQSEKISENLVGLGRDRRTTEEEEEEDPALRLSRHHNTAAAPTCPWRPSTSRMRRVSSCLGLPLPGTAPGCCGAGQGSASPGWVVEVDRGTGQPARVISLPCA